MWHSLATASAMCDRCTPHMLHTARHGACEQGCHLILHVRTESVKKALACHAKSVMVTLAQIGCAKHKALPSQHQAQQPLAKASPNQQKAGAVRLACLLLPCTQSLPAWHL
jgi:hypothetical protein